jgi:hypothetical protein
VQAVPFVTSCRCRRRHYLPLRCSRPDFYTRACFAGKERHPDYLNGTKSERVEKNQVQAVHFASSCDYAEGAPPSRAERT